MKIAIVVPRYGLDVVGGAETLSRGFAEEIACRGWTAEVWTTCARSHYTWDNVYPQGSEEINGVTVHRFPATVRDPDYQGELNGRLAFQMRLTAKDQYAWLETGAHSPLLYKYVSWHAAEFDVVVALPYAAPLVHYAAWVAPQSTVVWPCLHDEPYAYIEPVRLLLENARGVMFLSPEERDLAIRHLGVHPSHHGVLGGGVSLNQTQVDSTQPAESSSDLLYVGRLEEGKELSLLYNYVQRYVNEGGNIRLVVLGEGPTEPPNHPVFEYHGFVSDQDKVVAYASALAMCQPSVNESFSLTIMESWLAGRPVLVHSECAVTRGHVQRSKGGLWFQTYEEFVGAIEWLRNNPTLATRMGENGRRYVLCNYSWEAIVNRFERLIQQWRESDE